MMPALSLADLVQALTNAVVEAQNGVENQQIAMLSRFFDDKGRPICMPIMTPRMGFAEQDSDHTILNVPLISLVEATMLHITEFEVSFDVELSGLGEQVGDGLDHAPTASGAPTPAPDGLDHAPSVASPDAPPSPAAPSPAPSSGAQSEAATTQTAAAQAAPVQARQASTTETTPVAGEASRDAGDPDAGTSESEGQVFGEEGPFRRLLRSFGVRTTVPSIGLDAAAGAADPAPADTATDSAAGRHAQPVAERALIADPARAEDTPSPAEPPTPAMIVGLGPRGATAPTAKATLKVSSRAMSDGMVRLLNHLNKTF